MISDGETILNNMIEDGVIDNDKNGCYKPSDVFNTTMETISKITLKNISRGESGSKEFINSILDEPELILDGILISTIVNYSRIHLGINGMKKEEVEIRLSILKDYYEDDKYIKDIKKLRIGG